MRACSALPLILLLGVASPAAAVSLFGEVIAEDPTAIRPGEGFAVEIRFDTEGDEMSVFEGRFEVKGADVEGVSVPCSLHALGLCGTASALGNEIYTANTYVNSTGLFRLTDIRLRTLAATSATIDIVATDTRPLFAQKDTPSGVEDVLRITERVPLELRSQDVSLGTSLPIVPEPTTLVLMGMGLGVLAWSRNRAGP